MPITGPGSPRTPASSGAPNTTGAVRTSAPRQLPPEILQEVKKLHFHTRRLADQGLRGSYRSAFRGQGIEFEEVREYVPGDDVRSIDWKVTARSQKAFVKSYREERELTVLLAVDVSASTMTGSKQQLRETLLAKVGAVLTFIALANNDKVGLVTFSDRIEQYHPPRKARSAVWRILHEVLTPQAHGSKTALPDAIAFMNRVLKRKSIIFILSDFFDRSYELPLATLAKRHDVTAVVVRDPLDFALPAGGLVQVRDAETGEERVVDLADATVRDEYAKRVQHSHQALSQTFASLGIDALQLRTDEEFMPKLRRYFHSRSNLTRGHHKSTTRL